MSSHSISGHLLIPSIQRLNDIPATLREPQGEDEAAEKLEAERQAAQEFIDTGMRHLVNHLHMLANS